DTEIDTVRATVERFIETIMADYAD
ncbi:MAG: hypothetical protein ACI8W7_005162, partial [Gammaproteobacteria bacterium]